MASQKCYFRTFRNAFLRMTYFKLFLPYLEQCTGPWPLRPKEKDGLVVPPGKAYMLLTDDLFTG